MMTDLAVQGDAFFVVARGNENFYTRAGNFQLDAEGRLVSGTNGFRRAGSDGRPTACSRETLSDIRLPVGQKTPARATSSVTLAGNVDAAAEIGRTVSTTITVYDSLGAKHEMKIEMEEDQREGVAVAPGSDLAGPGPLRTLRRRGQQRTFVFGDDGKLVPAPRRRC
jgi:flagellar hook-basal body protein